MPRGTGNLSRSRNVRWMRTEPSGMAASSASDALSAEALVEAVDELGHGLELLGDDTDAVLAEVLRLDAEGVRDPRDDIVRGDRAVPVHDVVEVAGRKICLHGEAAVRRPGL